ncbi:cupin domain-containing protein [bacterium]|nr:cupin domain-containing protein [bacterium]
MKFEQFDLFHGCGRVEIEDLLRPRELTPFAEVLRCRLDPGAWVGAHRQEHHSEILLVAEGSGRAVVQGQPQALEAGSLVLLPLGQSLEIYNTDPEKCLTYFIVKGKNR